MRTAAATSMLMIGLSGTWASAAAPTSDLKEPAPDAAEAAPADVDLPAEPAAPPPDAGEEKLPWGIVEARVGGLFPSVFNKLSTTVTVRGAVAWQFAFARALGAYVEASYAEPSASGTRTDTRLAVNGGEERWALSVKEFALAVGPRFGFRLGRWFDGYVGAGLLVSFTRSVTTASAGDVELGTNTEYSTRLGGQARAGVGLKLGPGAIVLELGLAVLPVDHLITGDSNTSSLSAQLGYALYLR